MKINNKSLGYSIASSIVGLLGLILSIVAITSKMNGDAVPKIWEIINDGDFSAIITLNGLLAYYGSMLGIILASSLLIVSLLSWLATFSVLNLKRTKGLDISIIVLSVITFIFAVTAIICAGHITDSVWLQDNM